jgi:HK97 family phage major capsid protein
MSEAAWACEASCFANNPQPDLQEGLGELEIKAESLRFVACAGRDLLEDASFNIENWLVRKVEAGFRNSVSATIILGDGVGKPMGILNPRAGVVICETGQATAAGSVTWQDLYMLKWDVPQIWHSNAAFYMNARTFAQISTMSDAAGRPIFSQPPQGELVPTIAGSPVRILTQMPDIAPGSTPVMFGDLRAGYMLVTRSGLSMTPDPYTAGGWCVLFRFSMRVGGAPICPNAVRVLRIR